MEACICKSVLLSVQTCECVTHFPAHQLAVTEGEHTDGVTRRQLGIFTFDFTSVTVTSLRKRIHVVDSIVLYMTLLYWFLCCSFTCMWSYALLVSISLQSPVMFLTNASLVTRKQMLQSCATKKTPTWFILMRRLKFVGAHACTYCQQTRH